MLNLLKELIYMATFRSKKKFGTSGNLYLFRRSYLLFRANFVCASLIHTIIYNNLSKIPVLSFLCRRTKVWYRTKNSPAPLGFAPEDSQPHREPLPGADVPLFSTQAKIPFPSPFSFLDMLYTRLSHKPMSHEHYVFPLWVAHSL